MNVKLLKINRLQQSYRNRRTGFGVGEGVVMVGEVVAADGGDGLELVVRKGIAKPSPGGSEGVIERVAGIIHLIETENGLEASFVEAAVVGDQRKPFDARSNLFPDIGKYGRIHCILFGQAVNLLAKPLIVFGFGVDEAVEPVHDLSVADNDDADAAHAGRAFVRRFKIDCCKITHKNRSFH